MVTPCNHTFHAVCLSCWARSCQRLGFDRAGYPSCPCCRTPLPPHLLALAADKSRRKWLRPRLPTKRRVVTVLRYTYGGCATQA